VPQCAELLPGYDAAGCIFTPFWETPVLIQPSGLGGTNWAPMPYSPDTGYFYVPGTIRSSAFTRYSDKYVKGLRYTGGGQSAPIDSPMFGTFTAIDAKTNKIAWQHKTPYRLGGGGGSTVTAGGLVLRGEPDGNFLALMPRVERSCSASRPGSGPTRRRWSMRWMASSTSRSPPGAIHCRAAHMVMPSGCFPSTGSSVRCGRHRRLRRLPVRSARLPRVSMRSRSAAGNTEYSFAPARTRIKAGTTVTFSNVGDIPHDATALRPR
jgi:alcohol dehydrogenase (cytochrome c)